MSEWLTLLEEHSGALTVLWTAVYSCLTILLVWETRRLRAAQTEPRMDVTLKPRDEFINILNLYIRNIGLGPAYDIRFEIKAIVGGKAAEEIIEDFCGSNFLRTGINYLGPGQEVPSSYTSMTNNFDGKIESILQINVKYQNTAAKRYRTEFLINLSELKGRRQLGKPPLYSIAKSLEAIQRDLHSVTSGSRRIQTNIFTGTDRKVKEEQREDWLQQVNRKPAD